MKPLAIFLMSLMASWGVMGAEVVSGSYDYRTRSIVVDVVYQGGCKDHVIQLHVNACNVANPATCVVEVIDRTQDDACRALIHKTIRVPEEALVGEMTLEQVIVLGDHDSAKVIEIK